MSAWRSWLYSTWLLFPLEQQLEVNCLQKKRILRLKDVMCIMMWQNKHSLVTVRQATELVHIRIVHDRKEGVHCSGKWFLTPDFHLLVKNRTANLGPASLMTLWNLSFDTQQNHYERRGSLQRVRTCHGALTHSILDLDAREILLSWTMWWAPEDDNKMSAMQVVTLFGGGHWPEKRERAGAVKTSADSSQESHCMMKFSLLKYYIYTRYMLIVPPCCRKNTKSTVFTAKTCGSGRMRCNIKQLLLTFAQTLWRSEPSMFLSTAESEPSPRAKFCCIKCFMSSLFLCVHCICMCWNMFMYVGMCTRACMWRPEVVFLNYSPP